MPIPGTTKLHRLEENIAAADVTLTDHDQERLDEALARLSDLGERYPEAMQRMIDR